MAESALRIEGLKPPFSDEKVPGGAPSATSLRGEPSDAGEERVEGAPPRQVPSALWSRAEGDLTLFVEEELSLCSLEREVMMRNFARWKIAYKAPIPSEPKHFPIHNASNLTIPVIKEIVNTIVSQIVQQTLTVRPFWHFKDLAAEWEPFVDELERFLDVAASRDLKIDEKGVEWITEAVKLGTSILEVGYEVDERKVYRYTSDGEKTYPKKTILHDGPITYKIPLQDFWIRIGERDIQKARWVAKRLYFSERDLRERQKQKKFRNVEKVLAHYRTDSNDTVRQTVERMERTQPTNFQRYEVFEIYLSYDIDGDGFYEELRLFYHRDSRTWLSAQFNPYWHSLRPFVKLGFSTNEDRFYDEGICEMLEAIQLGISTKHNQRSDNATMANLKMIVKRKLLKSLQPGDPLYTGKIIEANDIWNDLREFQLAEIYPSTVSEEQILRQYAERLSGHNEATAGSAMPVSRTTAAAQLALLQEQRNRIGLVVSGVRKGLNQVGWFALQLYFQHGTNGKAVAWLGEKGRTVDAIFRLPRRVLELGLGIQATMPSSTLNQQVRRENSIGMFNLLVQLYERLLPLVQVASPESLPEVIRAMVRSANRFMGDVLESFEITDPEDALEGLAVLEKLLPAPENLGGMEAFRKREEESKVIDQLSRLEDLLREAEGARGGNEGLRTLRQRADRAIPSQSDVRRPIAGVDFGGEPVLGRGGRGGNGGAFG